MPELLAPAGSMESLIAALRCGADAVYAGAEQFSARQSAKNFDPPALKEALDLCHSYGKKFYLTANTLVFDREMKSFLDMISYACECGIHGVIVQDIGACHLMKNIFPTLPLHASTQMSLHSPMGIEFAKSLGLKRVVISRECSKTEIAELLKQGLEIEMFVHGALCMSVSGQCLLSAMIGGRSANRGRCAQPCRLPLTANKDKSFCGLSLRDLSLLGEIQEIQSMGVSSLKIEGRMKRPEYVAAAVTAFRRALDGKEPDYEQLQAVFSRNGFTNGYYIGNRENLYGTRRKEDVISATEVLKDLQQLYQKEPSMVPLTAEFQAKKGCPVSLIMKDDMGNCGSALGTLPEDAERVSLSAERVEKQISKLGGTIYYLNTCSYDIEDGLSVSAGELNTLRRTAVEELERNRKTRNKPCYQKYSIEQSKGVTEFARPRVRVEVRTEAQAKAVASFDSSFISEICLPFSLAEKIDFPKDRIILTLPRYIVNEETLKTEMKSWKQKGYHHILCNNLAHISLGKEDGWKLHGGFGLNIVNSESVSVFLKQGMEDLLISPEVALHQYASLPEHSRTGMILYGHLPLMLTRTCPLKNQVGCKGKQCSHFMTDRTGRNLKILCSQDYTELLNAETIWYADKLEEIKSLGFCWMLFTDEDEKQTIDCLKAYQSHSKARPEKMTRGLLERGVQ